MIRNPTIRRLLAAGLLATTLLAGACGGSDDETAGSDTSSSTTASGEGTSEGAGAATGDTVDIVDFNYKPADLKVAAGTKVTFTNKDGFAHTVTAKDKSFDSGNLDKGATFEQTFEKAGTYEYLCAIHNSMTGKVTVS